MLAPALFLTASGSLLQNANNRLARISDRLRQTDEAVVAGADALEPPAMRYALLRRRAHLVLRALQLLHLAVTAFVLTSLLIAADATFERISFPWLPTTCAVLGASLLLSGSLVLWREARLAVRSLELSIAMHSSRPKLPEPDAPPSPRSP